VKKIFKYQLQPKPENLVEMPKGSRVLTIQTQGSAPNIWAEIDPDAPRIKRKFFIVATGQPMEIPETSSYLGTFQIQDGALVFHVYTDNTEYAVDP